ncbi:MAG: hypothetical protein ABFD54_17275 [Armatimonadota bacterium]
MPDGNDGKKVGLKWLVIAVVVVALLGAAAWWWQSSECSRLSDQRDKDIRASAERSAQTVARTIATFGNRQIIADNWEALQRYADDLVKAKSVAYVAILNSEGVAVVHTNRSFKGSKLAAPPKGGGAVAHASVPAMNLTKQVATVRVGINVGGH